MNFCFLFIFVFLLSFFKFFFFLSLIEWSFLLIKYNFYFNSVLFSIILILVSLRVLIFRSYYLKGEIYFIYYLFVLIIFVLSIYSLNFRNNTFIIIVSWDLLGITSFFLVLFYNNWDRCNGSINTVLTNRLGDYFIFVFFSSSSFLSYFFNSFSIFLWSSLFFLVLTAFTKSAQFPFSGWLPKAISAPTPVSSLVHRSTLVTAGLLLLFNFSLILINYFLITILFFFGLLTTLFSSLTALVEEDIKKVVALRTLSQIGFSIITLGLGFSFLSFIHLLSHALFKSCLFIQIGYLIHCSFGQQDGRFYSFLKFIPIFVQIQLLVTLFCLCGLFFTRGLVRKDLILEYFYFNNFWFIICIIFFSSIYLTFFYSYRLFSSLFMNFSSSFIHFRSSVLINFLNLFLCRGSIFFIWWLNYNFLFIPPVFLYIDFYVPIFYIFVFFFVLYFFIKFLLTDITFKFLADYTPKFIILNFFDLKFMEYFFFNLRSFFISFFISFSSIFNLFFLSNYFNSLLIIVFIIFIIFWGLILLKYLICIQKNLILYSFYFKLKYSVWVIKIYKLKTFILFRIFHLQWKG